MPQQSGFEKVTHDNVMNNYKFTDTTEIKDTDLFQFNYDFQNFCHAWRRCQNQWHFVLLTNMDPHASQSLNSLLKYAPRGPFPDRILELAASYVDFIRDMAPNANWSGLPAVNIIGNRVDADFLVALLAHCVKVGKNYHLWHEALSRIMIDAFKRYTRARHLYKYIA